MRQHSVCQSVTPSSEWIGVNGSHLTDSTVMIANTVPREVNTGASEL